MFRPVILSGIACLAITACTTAPIDYRPANGGAFGYAEQPIEQGRYRVSYTANTEALARRYALRRAAELTDLNGGDWFRVVNAYTSGDERSRSSRPSVSVGGSIGSGGYRSSGVGIGIGIPLGGSANEVTHSLEILIGRGPKPDGGDVYDATDVLMNMAGG